MITRCMVGEKCEVVEECNVLWEECSAGMRAKKGDLTEAIAARGIKDVTPADSDLKRRPPSWPMSSLVPAAWGSNNERAAC